jgi:predicted esterase
MAIAIALMHPDQFKAVGVVGGAKMGFGAASYLLNAGKAHLYMAHGGKDQNITLKEFYATKELLEKNGATVTYYIHENGGDKLHTGIIGKVIDWLADVQ